MHAHSSWWLRGSAVAVLVVVAVVAALAAVPSPTSAGAAACSSQVRANHGRPGFAMEQPRVAHDTSQHAASTACVGSYTHMPAPDSSKNLPPGSGPIMPSTTIYYDFWLPTGDHFESNAAGDANYENLLIRWAQDLGSTQYHNVVTQYYGNNGGGTTYITNSVSYGGDWVDTATYPHAGTTGDPLTDADIQTEVHKAATTNGWTEDLSHIIVVFTANGIQECNGGTCTYTGGGNGFCAYHNHFADGSADAVYAFMAYDNFVHVTGYTCVAGQTGGDNDPNRANYPNGDVSADAEVNTLSHEVTEAETDPHPNATWTGPNGEIGDACNFNFSPRNTTGADVYLNGHPYIVQQEYDNAVSTCGIDLATNGFCPGSVSSICSPSTAYSKSVDNVSPHVGSTINYTLRLNNTNDTGAETNLTVSDSPPSGYAITNVSAPGASSSPTWTSSSATINFDTLPVHQSRTITISATVPEQTGTLATNCGSLAGSDLIGTTLSTETTVPCASTTPTKIPTVLTYTGPSSGDYNDPVTVSANLTDINTNPLSGKSVSFTLNGTETCNSTTDGSGNVSCSITPGETPGPYTLAVAFSDASDPKYAISSISPAFTVNKDETTVTYTGPLTAHYHDAVTVAATLTDPDGGAPISGKQITFTLGVSDSCDATTDASGNASCSLTPHQTGTKALVASFAGDAYYLSSNDSHSFAITPEETTMSYTGPTVVLVNSSGATLTATLVEDGTNDSEADGGAPAPLPAELVTLALGSQSCTSTSATSGQVSCAIPSVTVPLGPETVSASFAGDTYYQAASDSKSAIVFAFPSRGAFTLSNLTVASATPSTTVTWWADIWFQLNSVSGRSAPSSFKGFAANLTNMPTTTPPTSCGGGWTTLPGNSPPPTSGVPSYMGVLVTSKVTQSGRKIRGNTVHIVVVKTNPGYAPDPMDYGTGTIVATFC